MVKGEAINLFANEAADIVEGAVSYIFSGNTLNPSGRGSNVVKPSYKDVKVEAKCPEKEISAKKKIYSTFQFEVPLSTINFNKGVIALSVDKTARSKFDIEKIDAKQLV